MLDGRSSTEMIMCEEWLALAVCFVAIVPLLCWLVFFKDFMHASWTQTRFLKAE